MILYSLLCLRGPSSCFRSGGGVEEGTILVDFDCWGLVCSLPVSRQAAPWAGSLSPMLFGRCIISHPRAGCQQSLQSGFGGSCIPSACVPGLCWGEGWLVAQALRSFSATSGRVMETIISPGKSPVWKPASSKVRQLPESGQAFVGCVASKALPLPNLWSLLQNVEILLWEKISVGSNISKTVLLFPNVHTQPCPWTPLGSSCSWLGWSSLNKHLVQSLEKFRQDCKDLAVTTGRRENFPGH